ncbi:MAG: di-trans,poly-cis-decaprenylcistransferase [Clostridia bacterium]|nr:di-trans,poly-cis-decaprenylcistransferase [Clostridia bacterium]
MFALIKKNFEPNVEKLVARGAAVKVVGNLSLLPDDVREVIEKSLEKSPESADFTFIMALGYGARDEIVQAANLAVKNNKEVDEEGFSSLLYTRGIPDPDFIIRTGGELRLSNFLLWQAAYAELYFTDVLFPDFTNAKFDKALANFSARARRFGKV